MFRKMVIASAVVAFALFPAISQAAGGGGGGPHGPGGGGGGGPHVGGGGPHGPGGGPHLGGHEEHEHHEGQWWPYGVGDAGILMHMADTSGSVSNHIDGPLLRGKSWVSCS